jgi:hypothetical protein
MITIYRALFLLSLLLVIVSLVLPVRHGIPIGMRLSGQPESWNLTFNTADHRLKGATEEQTKQMVLSYLRDHRLGDEAPLSGLTAPAVLAAIFSFVGWHRERDLRRRTDGVANRGQPVQPEKNQTSAAAGPDG